MRELIFSAYLVLTLAAGVLAQGAPPPELKAELHVSEVVPVELARAMGAQEAGRIIALSAANLARRVKSLDTADLTSVSLAHGTHTLNARLQRQDAAPSRAD